MKKFIKYVTIVIVLFAIGYWGYKRSQDTASLLGKIHIEADTAIKIAVQEIKETLVLDALMAAGYYYDHIGFSGSRKESDSLGERGIDLTPYNVVFYTVPQVKNTLFSTFEIYDAKGFESFVQAELKDESIPIVEAEGHGYYVAVLPKWKMALAWNDIKMVCAFSPEIEKSIPTRIFADILNEDKTIQDNKNPLITTLLKSDHHLTWVDDQSTVTIDFEDGQAIIEGAIYTEVPQRFQPEITIESIEGASFQLVFDANFDYQGNREMLTAILEGNPFFEKNNVSLPEVLRRTNGYINVAVNGRTSQTDTITTYEFDDNFEKVAKKSVQEKEVPKVHIALGAENESLMAYLEEQETLNPDSVFEPFPLYQLYVKDGPMYTSFDTYKGNVAAREQISANFFDCRIDFDQLRRDILLPQAGSYLKPLEKFHLTAAQSDPNKVVVKGSLFGKEADINMLSQVFFSTKKDSIR
ncbi:hypothetical protein FK220_006695 [Flavobacteriaceae bacterium TP-CH-4]|uniref:Uncharacterized protein n=1 Tax=Pelagihabitans pacificus TaxID=2696054 RepID=A0A967ATQ4_9FLAO|nr:hypothetical protein [Pelagihabitans pacificus]NHF59020.1 hypothetical protein [Pelagihabitans pacificus]